MKNLLFVAVLSLLSCCQAIALQNGNSAAASNHDAEYELPSLPVRKDIGEEIDSTTPIRQAVSRQVNPGPPPPGAGPQAAAPPVPPPPPPPGPPPPPPPPQGGPPHPAPPPPPPAPPPAGAQTQAQSYQSPQLPPGTVFLPTSALASVMTNEGVGAAYCPCSADSSHSGGGSTSILSFSYPSDTTLIAMASLFGAWLGSVTAGGGFGLAVAAAAAGSGKGYLLSMVEGEGI
ncbi:hypothetical protein PG984_007928 [Apiospora sp. TS-2023a]